MTITSSRPIAILSLRKVQGGSCYFLSPGCNFFTNDLKDAVRGTTLQFLIDAQRDGNL